MLRVLDYCMTIETSTFDPHTYTLSFFTVTGTSTCADGTTFCNYDSTPLRRKRVTCDTVSDLLACIEREAAEMRRGVYVEVKLPYGRKKSWAFYEVTKNLIYNVAR
jgi:hypothetical protein